MESRHFWPDCTSSASHISVEQALLFDTFYRGAVKFLELAALFAAFAPVTTFFGP